MRPFLPLLFVLALGLEACSFNYGATSGEDEAAKPDVVFTNFVHTVMSGQARSMELKAARAEDYSGKSLMVLSEVSFTQFDRSTGKMAATGTADSAIFHTDTENAEFSGNIVLESVSEDAKLKAESLSWDSESKTLAGGIDRTVLVLRGDGTWIRGAGFQVDTARRVVTFREAVEGDLVAAKEGGAEVAK